MNMTGWPKDFSVKNYFHCSKECNLFCDYISSAEWMMDLSYGQKETQSLFLSAYICNYSYE